MGDGFFLTWKGAAQPFAGRTRRESDQKPDGKAPAAPVTGHETPHSRAPFTLHWPPMGKDGIAVVLAPGAFEAVRAKTALL